MKKLFSVIIILSLIFTLTACGGSTGNSANENSSSSSRENGSASVSASETDNADDSNENANETNQNENSANSLVVYFSWSGNTENVAEAIAEQTGSDIFEIIPETPYSDDYNTVIDVAQSEQRSNARPSISGSISNIEQYDVIYVGFPNWWGDMPMILYIFFDTYDLSGKTVAPFCTSGGSGLSDTVNTIKELEPSADVLNGLHIGSGSASNPDNAVSEWLTGLGLIQ